MTDVAQIIADIEAWLDKATPGEWTIEPHGDGQVLYSGRGPTRHGLNLVYLREGDWNWHTNANYIVSVGPDRIRALLDEVKRAQSERDDFLENIDQLRKSVEWTKSQEALKLHNDLLARAEAAEAELARLRKPVTDGELAEQAVQAAIDAGVAVNGEQGIASARVAARYVIARLRAPAGDVGEVVQSLDEAIAEGAGPLATDCRDLLTRQAAEIERLKIDVNRWHAVVDIVSVNAGLGSASLDPIKMGPELGKRVRSVVAAEAGLREAVDDLRMIDASIFNDNGDVTWSPLEIRANFRALMAKVNDWMETNHE